MKTQAEVAKMNKAELVAWLVKYSKTFELDPNENWSRFKVADLRFEVNTLCGLHAKFNDKSNMQSEEVVTAQTPKSATKPKNTIKQTKTAETTSIEEENKMENKRNHKGAEVETKRTVKPLSQATKERNRKAVIDDATAEMDEPKRTRPLRHAPTPKPEPKPVAKTASKPATKPSSKTEKPVIDWDTTKHPVDPPKESAKPATKPKAKPEPKPATKPVAKAEPKPEPKPNAKKSAKKTGIKRSAPTAESDLKLLSRRIVSRTSKSYSLEVGEYEILIPRKSSADVLKDLRVGYMYIASDEEIMEGNSDFEMDLDDQAKAVVTYYEKWMPKFAESAKAWYTKVEKAADISVTEYRKANNLVDEKEYDEDYEEDDMPEDEEE